jgi:F-type H+-transporting ATPase subunit delta
MKGASRGVARRYARALFEVASAEGTARALRSELEGSVAALRGSPELEAALLHPALSSARKREIVERVFAAGSPLLRRALELLISRGRLSQLPLVAEQYTLPLLESENMAQAELVTAAPLAQADVERISAALAAATGKGIELRARSEPELLGGVLVKIGGRHFDGSVRGRLQALRARLSAA